jgi:hypothetical protein
MGIVVGAPGIGKTTTIEHYQWEKQHVFLATMFPGVKTTAHLLRTLEKSILGGNSFRRTGPNDVYHELRDWFVRAPTLLIIDEAQHLEPAGLETLRCLHDESRCGLVLSGNPTITTRLEAAPARFAQFLSRIGIRFASDGAQPEDVQCLLDHHEIADPRARTALARIGNRKRELRTPSKIINLARGVAGEQPIEFAHVERALEMFGMEEQ